VAQASLRLLEVHSPARFHLHHLRPARMVAAGAVVPAEEGEEAVAGVGEGITWEELYFYFDPTRCTLNSSPRGQVTLFFFLQ